jgi:hypothetical protein
MFGFGNKEQFKLLGHKLFNFSVTGFGPDVAKFANKHKPQNYENFLT